MKTIEIIVSARRLGQKGEVVERQDEAADQWIKLGYAVEVKGGTKTTKTEPTGNQDQNPEN